MSRSGYSESCDGWDLIRWRGAVTSALRGKRGQAFLRELEASLVALPEKKLIPDRIASCEEGRVCALGSVALSRKLNAGVSLRDALVELEREWPEEEYDDRELTGKRFGIAEAMAAEIMYLNDEAGWRSSPAERYRRVLEWVRGQLRT